MEKKEKQSVEHGLYFKACNCSGIGYCLNMAVGKQLLTDLKTFCEFKLQFWKQLAAYALKTNTGFSQCAVHLLENLSLPHIKPEMFFVFLFPESRILHWMAK